MTHLEKLGWMMEFAKKNNAIINLNTSCGLGRPCVGLVVDESFPDYEWFGNDWERIDPNGEVWIPEHAYHKHPCVAVLGTGEAAEEELYEWLKWFDDNNFIVEIIDLDNKDELHFIELMMGRNKHRRMIKKGYLNGTKI